MAEPPNGSVTGSDEPSTKAEAIKLIGGLVVVCSGLVVILVVTLLAIYLVRKQSEQVVALAASAFSIVGTIVGAYFGLKIGTDGTRTATESADNAVSAMREEAAKAQAFAMLVPREDAEKAITMAALLASGDPAMLPADDVAGDNADDQPGGTPP